MKTKKVFKHPQTYSRWAIFVCSKVSWRMVVKSALCLTRNICCRKLAFLYKPFKRYTERVLDDKRLVKKNYTIPKNIEVYD